MGCLKDLIICVCCCCAVSAIEVVSQAVLNASAFYFYALWFLLPHLPVLHTARPVILISDPGFPLVRQVEECAVCIEVCFLWSLHPMQDARSRAWLDSAIILACGHLIAIIN